MLNINKGQGRNNIPRQAHRFRSGLFDLKVQKLGILHFEVKVADTFIGTKNCKLQKRLIAP
ncbi:MAG: hypothetical protein B1H11_10070 [Desulfobacteraceae bacterium 4484_190.1]|nr:MAG: hypothetical protein B1H11_10070 [Desulfobacteraceae bacterium 4484_190.1]